jgi:hypothetical protein
MMKELICEEYKKKYGEEPKYINVLWNSLFL